MYFVDTSGLTIFEQLQLEEALLRADDQEWCLFNGGGVHPAIVMGISGQPEKLLDIPLVVRDGIPVIKRFSVGGTVYVDQQTVFVTFIRNAARCGVPAQARPIMQWTEELYRPLFSHDSFRLRENDYVFGEKKFGGNAQYIQRERWLHHTSFLWEFDAEKMRYLKLPEKRPAYRGERDHRDFLCNLKDFFRSKTDFQEQFKTHLFSCLPLQEKVLEEAVKIRHLSYRQSTSLVQL